jgi:LysM repeat protein
MKYSRLLLLLSGLTLSGCSLFPAQSPDPQAVLTPYETRTASVSTVPAAAPTLEPPPASTRPTQITHVVKKGEDMGGIANTYGVKTKDLKDANPKVDPRMMPIGTVLIIPSGDPTQDAFQPTAIPTPAVILQTGAPVCYPDPSGGAWCLMKVENNTNGDVQDISADFVISGSDGGEIQTGTAYCLLDRLQSGLSIPLAVYFPKTPSQPWQVTTRLRTASPIVKDAGRYLISDLKLRSSDYSADKLSIQVNGTVNLQANQKDANIIHVVGAAYNAAGQPVGVRRWDSTVGLESGSGLVYDFIIYSLGGPIDHVEILGETRPK